jgi:hypothetical protein
VHSQWCYFGEEAFDTGDGFELGIRSAVQEGACNTSLRIPGRGYAPERMMMEHCAKYVGCERQIRTCDEMPILRPYFDLPNRSASASDLSGGHCAKKQCHLPIICVNLFGSWNDSMIFTKSDRDQKTVFSPQSVSASMYEYLGRE